MTAGGSAADTAYRGQKALLHALLRFSGGNSQQTKDEVQEPFRAPTLVFFMLFCGGALIFPYPA